MHLTSNRARPDFAVVGAMRGGTTQLYEILRNVPSICLPRMKETDFFCSPESVAKGEAWFARQFAEPASLWGDISPNYAKTDINPHAARLLYAANPGMQIFFIARDPIERAISQYRMEYFIDANLPGPDAVLSTWAGKHIVHASRYHACLQPFWDLFGEQVTILDFDVLTERPNEVIATICAKLGIAPAEVSMAGTPRNSFDELSRTPGWWAGLRRSEFGTAVRAQVPRALLNFVKARAVLATPRAAPPPFTDAVRAQIADLLSADIRQFRERSQMAFEAWSI